MEPDSPVDTEKNDFSATTLFPAVAPSGKPHSRKHKPAPAEVTFSEEQEGAGKHAPPIIRVSRRSSFDSDSSTSGDPNDYSDSDDSYDETWSAKSLSASSMSTQKPHGGMAPRSVSMNEHIALIPSFPTVSLSMPPTPSSEFGPVVQPGYEGSLAEPLGTFDLKSEIQPVLPGGDMPPGYEGEHPGFICFDDDDDTNDNGTSASSSHVPSSVESESLPALCPVCAKPMYTRSLFPCPTCGKVFYCSADHQERDWRSGHDRECAKLARSDR
jgi:MYND finger